MRNTRWICKSCKLKWITPVEACVKCEESTERVVGKSFVVKAKTEVRIGSASHPAPYYVLLLEDENKHLRPIKSTKEYAVGEEYREEGLVVIDNAYDEESAWEEARERLSKQNIVGERILTAKKLAFSEVIVFAKSKEELEKTKQQVSEMRTK